MMKFCNILFLCFFMIIITPLFSLDPKKEILDLEKKINQSSSDDKHYLLTELSKLYWGINPMKSIDLAKESLKTAQFLKNPKMESISLRLIGAAYKNIGEVETAYDYFKQSLKIANQYQFLKEKADVLNNIAILENSRGNLDQAVKYYQETIEIYTQIGDSKSVAIPLSNMGIIYLKMDLPAKALECYQKALEIRLKFNDLIGAAVVYNLMAKYYLNEENYSLALSYAQKSLQIREKSKIKGDLSKSYESISEIYKGMKVYQKALHYAFQAEKIKLELKDQNGLALTYQNIGDLFYILKNYSKAQFYLNKSLKISKKIQSNSFLIDIYLKLSEIYYQLGDLKKAYENLQNYQKYSEEIIHLNLRKITQFEAEKKENELQIVKKDSDLKTAQVRFQNFIIVSLTIFIAAIGIFLYFLIREKRKSEKLLLNILPRKVAEDLKQKGFSIPDKFENVTVFFSDMVDFTKISDRLEPSVLIQELSDIFTNFDEIMHRNNCERIKTIGDAYLAVCGMPVDNIEHACCISKAALEIIDYLTKRNQKTLIQWQVRIGLHSGSLVGGIVGTKKYIYDIFGDTVNTASRMEHYSEPMRINVSQSTYSLLKDKYSFSVREILEVKGKGMTQMYFLNSDH